MRAARTLAHAPDKAGARALTDALAKDRSPQVRMACAIALAEGFKKDGRARVALERCLLEDRDPHARRAAAYALGHFGEAAETALLECIDRERSYLVKAAALKALAFAGIFGYVALTHSIEQALPLLIGPVLGAIGLYALLKWRHRRARAAAAEAQPTAPGDPTPSPVEEDVAA
jgi:hypothetical protein